MLINIRPMIHTALNLGAESLRSVSFVCRSRVLNCGSGSMSFQRIRNMFQGPQQGRDGEAELELFYMQSHGRRVAGIHMHDWLILILLAIIDIGLNVIHPFYRFVGKDMMTDFKYPLKENTVPFWAVPIYAVILPIVVFLFIYIRRRDVHDLHHAILGLLFSVLITGVLTDAIKDATGRPRPDFFWRCFPDGVDNYDHWGNVICTGKDSLIRDGHKSFPSGHTSLSFAGLSFLALYLAGKIKVFDRRGHVAKLCVIFLPLLMASLVAVSRVDDYRHHWQDVSVGGLLGLTVATFCYLQFFPAPYHTEGWGPYAYFCALGETRSTRRVSHPVDEVRTQSVVLQDVNQQLRQNNHALGPIDLESGKL